MLGTTAESELSIGGISGSDAGHYLSGLLSHLSFHMTTVGIIPPS
jgi:hypothetical protein